MLFKGSVGPLDLEAYAENIGTSQALAIKGICKVDKISPAID